MAPKIKVPMDFGVHLRSSPTHNTLKLNTSEGGEVLASSVILSFNSPVIDHMTTTLHMTSVDMLEFSEAAVQVFVNAAYSGTAEGINREIFRDINKMSNVFEVAWLVEKCSEHFTEVTNSIKTPSYSELLYLFEEACFVYENLNKKDYIELVNDKIQELNWKQQFIDKYLENVDRLSTKKLDMVIELAGSDVNFVVQTLVNQLTEMFKVQGPYGIPTSCKYLLENMDLSNCIKSERSGFYQLFELLRDLPSEHLRWSFDLMLKSTKKVVCSDVKCESKQTSTLARCNTVPNLYHNCDFNMNFDELFEWISASDTVTNLLMATEAVVTWRTFLAVNKAKGIFCYVGVDQLNIQLADLLIKHQTWPLLQKVFRNCYFRFYCDASKVFDKSLEGFCSPENASTSSVIIDGIQTFDGPFRVLSTNSKLTFHFKHPSVTSCNQPGKCGFILKTVPSEAALWKLELCTEDKDYRDSDVHFHEEIRAENMHIYFLRVMTQNKHVMFPLTWLGPSCISSSANRDRWRKYFASNGHSRFCILYESI